MKKVTGRALYRIAYDAVLSVGMDSEDFDIEVSRYRDEEDRKWYSLRLEYRDEAYTRQATVYYGCADEDQEKTRKAIRQFRWVLKHKARSILKRQKVSGQGFYDAIWYSASMTLNGNPLVARWFIQDERDTKDRTLWIVWARKGEKSFRRDAIGFSRKDFINEPMESCEAIDSYIKQVAEEAAVDSLPKSSADVRRRW